MPPVVANSKEEVCLSGIISVTNVENRDVQIRVTKLIKKRDTAFATGSARNCVYNDTTKELTFRANLLTPEKPGSYQVQLILAGKTVAKGTLRIEARKSL